MKQIIYFSFFIISMIVVFAACDSNIEDYQTDYKYEYFPLEMGKTLTYEVDSIVYSTSSGGDILKETASYELRETVVDTFRDNENRLVYEVERQRRDSATMDWQIQEVLKVYRGETRLEWTENNRTFLKMIFPIKAEQTWDGNMFFDETELVAIRGEVIELFKSWESQTADVDVPATVNSNSFENTTTIYQANAENLIELRFSQEQYAKDVGLIYKEVMILDTQCIEDCLDMTWEEKAEKGFILRMRIKAF